MAFYAINEMIHNHGTFISFVFFSVLTPAIEEFSFRFWGTGKKHAYLISSILITTCLILLGTHWISIVTTAIALTAITFLLKGDVKTYAMLLTTCTIFTTLHSSFSINMSAAEILGLLHIFGSSLIFCYLTIRFNIIWAIAAHGLLNFIAIYSTTFGELHLQTENADIFVKPCIDEYYTHDNVGETDDTIAFNGGMPLIANSMMYHENAKDSINYLNCKTFHFTKKGTDIPYSVKIIPKGEISYPEIIRELEKQNLLAIDTTFEPFYILSITDQTSLNSHTDGEESSIADLVWHTQTRYSVPLTPDNFTNENFPIRINYNAIDSLDFAEYCNLMKTYYGIDIWKSEQSRARIIKFSSPD